MSDEMRGWSQPKAGTFCWTEIGCSDSAKSMEFFKNVFGWEFKAGGGTDGGMEYNEFSTTAGAEQVGGLYQADPAWGMPPHIMNYLAVDDVDENTARAEQLGAKVHRKMDVPGVGRIAIIEDPTGAMFATYKQGEERHG
jgi:uncharacterized protein